MVGGTLLPQSYNFLQNPPSKLMSPMPTSLKMKPLPLNWKTNPPPLKNEAFFQEIIPRKNPKESETDINTCQLVFQSLKNTGKRWQKFYNNMIFLLGASKILSEKWSSFIWIHLISFYAIYLKLPCFKSKFCKQTCWIKLNLIACTSTCGCLLKYFWRKSVSWVKKRERNI